MEGFQNSTTDNKEKAEKLLRFGEETISVFGVDDVFEDLYFDGWKPSDERFEKVLLAALREAGNRLPGGQEHMVARFLVKQFSKYCAAQKYGTPGARCE
jgi:hypothetical protein